MDRTATARSASRMLRLVHTIALLAALGSGAASAGGALLWKDHFDRAGGFDRGNAMATAGRFAFAIGTVVGDAGDSDGLIRGYDSVSGALLWEDQVDLGGEDGFISVAAGGKAVFACGLGMSGIGESNVLLVRAYDARTGALLWEDRSTRGGATDVKVDRDVLVVGGFANDDDGGFLFLVRAYDTRTGALLWENGIEGDGFVNAIHARGGRVYAVGAGDVEEDGRAHFIVRAYGGRTGALLWESRDDRAGLLDFAASVVAEGGRVHVAGTVSHEDGSCTADFFTGNCDFLVRTYDAATGGLLWDDEVDKVGHRDHAYSVVATGGRIFVGGLGSTDFTRNFLLRAYDAASGAFLWEVHDSDRGGAVNSLAASANAVYAGGDGALPVLGSSLDFLVRAYDPSTGALLWEDKHDEAGGADTVIGLAARRGRVFAAGGVVSAFGDSDFAIRTYTGD